MSRQTTSIGTALSKPTLRSEEHTSELQSQSNLVCRLLLEKKKKIYLCTHLDFPCSHMVSPNTATYLSRVSSLRYLRSTTMSIIAEAIPLRTASAVRTLQMP